MQHSLHLLDQSQLLPVVELMLPAVVVEWQSVAQRHLAARLHKQHSDRNMVDLVLECMVVHMAAVVRRRQPMRTVVDSQSDVAVVAVVAVLEVLEVAIEPHSLVVVVLVEPDRWAVLVRDRRFGLDSRI